STSRKPKRSSSSRTISTLTPLPRSTKPFPPPKPGAWSNASNGITRPNTAPGWTWPNPNSASSPRNVSTGASPTNRQSSTRSPPGSANETRLTPSPSGTSQPTTPASNSKACTLRYDRIAPLDAFRASDWLEAGPGGGGAYPPVNVFRKGDDFIIITEPPGVKKSDLDLQVKGRTLRLSGQKAVAFAEKTAVHRRE